ncbi:hypothetical protein [Plectonema radiosum]|nr:hypothetical protein [Plectonema radiosum]
MILPGLMRSLDTAKAGYVNYNDEIAILSKLMRSLLFRAITTPDS